MDQRTRFIADYLRETLNIPSRNMLTRRFAMPLFIVEDYVRSECFQEFAFFFPTGEQCFIDTYLPHT